jgi:hypothetical protein
MITHPPVAFSSETHWEYPSPRTQAGRFLAALLSDKHIDPLHGWFTLGIYRLSDTTLQLRKLGWPVITGQLIVKNRYGEECRVAQYYLQPEIIEETGEPGRQFISQALASSRRTA